MTGAPSNAPRPTASTRSTTLVVALLLATIVVAVAAVARQAMFAVGVVVGGALVLTCVQVSRRRGSRQ